MRPFQPLGRVDRLPQHQAFGATIIKREEKARSGTKPPLLMDSAKAGFIKTGHFIVGSLSAINQGGSNCAPDAGNFLLICGRGSSHKLVLIVVRKTHLRSAKGAGGIL